MCHNPASHWSFLPPTALILCRRRLDSKRNVQKLNTLRCPGPLVAQRVVTFPYFHLLSQVLQRPACPLLTRHAGYNNLPTDREYVMCAWDDTAKDARFSTSRVMMFSSTASVNHFCRLPAIIKSLCTRLFGTLARAYVDDWVITDLVAARDSAQRILGEVQRDIGIPLAACQHACCNQCHHHPRPDPPPILPKCKRKIPSQIQELLGVVCDVSPAHTGSVRYSPKPTRCSKVLRELEAASKSTLSAKQAERLCGKLQSICNSPIFGSVGRAKTLALHRRSQSRSLDGRSPCTSDA